MKHLGDEMNIEYNTGDPPEVYIDHYEAEIVELMCDDPYDWANKYVTLEAQLASARAIMQRFVDKVDTGRARSTETYREMKEWLDD